MTALILAAFAVVVLATVLGYAMGFRRGKDAGWLDHHFADIARDRSRRQRNGRFKAKEAKAL